MATSQEVQILLKAIDQTAPAVKSATANIAGIKNAFVAVQGSIGSAEGALARMANVVTALGKGFVLLEAVNIFKNIADKAAEVERLGTVVKMVGANAGYMAAQIDDADKKIQALGITASASRKALTLFIQSGLQLEGAAKLARAAQDLAVISGENSSDTMRGLTQAISEQSIMMLRWRGITLTNEEAQEKYAATQGKSVSSLADWEKKQALLNLTLERSARLSGIYEAAMGDVGKQASSLARYQEDAAVSIENAMLPAYSKMVTELTIFLRNIKLMTDESNNTTAFAKNFGDGVGTVAHSLRGALELVYEYREGLMGLGKAYALFKGVQLGMGALKTAKETIVNVAQNGVGSKARAEAANAQATETHAAASTHAATAINTESVATSKLAAMVNSTAAAYKNMAASRTVALTPPFNKTAIASGIAGMGAAGGSGGARYPAGAAGGKGGQFMALGGVAKDAAAIAPSIEKAAKSTHIFGTAISYAASLARGLWLALGGWPGAIITAALGWVMFGNGMKVIGGLYDTLTVKSKNFMDTLHGKLTMDKGLKKELENRVADRNKQLADRNTVRAQENTPEAKEYKNAIKTQKEAEEKLRYLEYQKAAVAEKLKSSYSQADQEKSVEILAEIQEAKTAAASAKENADKVAKDSKLHPGVRDTLASQADKEAYAKGVEYKQSQELNDVFTSRANIGMSKEVFSLGAPVSMEFSNALTGVRKEVEAFSTSLKGADGSIQRVSFAYNHFIDSAKTIGELVVAQQEWTDLIDTTTQRLTVLQMLKDGATAPAEGSSSKEQALFKSTSDKLRKDSRDSGIDPKTLIDEQIAATAKLKEGYTDFGDPLKASQKRQTEIVGSDEKAKAYYDTLVQTKQVGAGLADSLKGDLAGQIDYARDHIAQLTNEFKRTGVTLQGLAKEKQVFQAWQLAIQGITKDTAHYATMLEKVSSLMQTSDAMRAKATSGAAFKGDATSSVGAAIRVAAIQQRMAQDLAGAEWKAQKERDTSAVNYAKAVDGAHINTENSAVRARADEEAKLKTFANGNLNKNQHDENSASSEFTPKKMNVGEAKDYHTTKLLELENRLRGEGKGLALDTYKSEKALAALREKEKGFGVGSDPEEREANAKAITEELNKLHMLRAAKDADNKVSEAHRKAGLPYADKERSLSDDGASSDKALLDVQTSKLKSIDAEKERQAGVPEEMAKQHSAAVEKETKEVLAAESIRAESLRGIESKLADSKIKISKEAYDAMHAQLDSYVSAYQAKLEAIHGLHKAQLEMASSIEQRTQSDVIAREEMSMNPSKRSIYAAEGEQGRMKVSATTAGNQEDLASLNKEQAARKELVRTSNASDSEKQAQLSQIETEGMTKRLEINRTYYGQLSTLREEALSKAKAHAQAAVGFEKAARDTILEGNKSIRETNRIGMSSPDKYEDQKRENTEAMDRARELERAGDYASAAQQYKQAQSSAHSLASAEGIDPQSAKRESMSRESEATAALANMQQQQAGIERAGETNQMATVQNVTEAMSTLASSMRDLSQSAELKLSPKMDGEAIAQLQAQLKGLSADTETAIKVSVDNSSLSSLYDQVDAALNKKSYTVKVEASTTGGGSNTVEAAGGGLINGIGTGTSDSIPALLSDGEFVVKRSAADHYGSGFLNLLNSKSLRFANGGSVGGERGDMLDDLLSTFGFSKKDITRGMGSLLGGGRQYASGNATTGIRGNTGGMATRNGFVAEYGTGLYDAFSDMGYAKFADGGLVGAASDMLNAENLPNSGQSMTPSEMIELSVKIGEAKASKVQGSRDSIYNLVHSLRDLQDRAMS